MNTIKSPVPELFIDFSLLYVKEPVFIIIIIFFLLSKGGDVGQRTPL